MQELLVVYDVASKSAFSEVQGVYDIVVIRRLPHQYINGKALTLRCVSTGAVTKVIGSTPVYKLKALWRMLAEK